VLRGLKFCHGYIDDVLVASKDEEEHRHHLEEVFKRLKKYGLSINVAKNVFEEHEVGVHGIQSYKKWNQPS